LARFCIVEALAGGEMLLGRYAELSAELAQVVDRGRSAAPNTRKPTPVIADGVVGAVAHILHKRLRDTAEEPVSGLLGSLMSIVVLPYLGETVAREELARPAPETELVPRREAHRDDPFEGLSRLTYRTARVLSAIRENPGGSNREIGIQAGIVDQGQISKLLTRLANNKLVENRGGGQQHGVANAWNLTPRGQKIEQSVSPRFGFVDSESAAVPRRGHTSTSAASR
jgi:DNA-binding MarR family transcriptional regulator